MATAGTREPRPSQSPKREPEVVLLDLRLPDMNGLEVLKAHPRDAVPPVEVIMLTGHGSIDTAIESIRVRRVRLRRQAVPARRARDAHPARARAPVAAAARRPARARTDAAGPAQLVRRREPASSAQLLHLIERVAAERFDRAHHRRDRLRQGEVAKLLHARSRARPTPFVVVECAALQESLLQSELFGHERGAFTGADRAKPGLFEVAHGGTIFLDEIGEVSPATQVKLLRVLDTSTFRHVGGTSEIRVDVRVLAATNRDLSAMVRQGLFREDPVLPAQHDHRGPAAAARARAGDVELLAGHFVAALNERYRVVQAIGAERRWQTLRRHDWPGNVRELLHAIEAAMVVCDGVEICPEHLPAAIRSGRDAAADRRCCRRLRSWSALTSDRALESSDGHRGSAAKILGISERISVTAN